VRRLLAGASISQVCLITMKSCPAQSRTINGSGTKQVGRCVKHVAVVTLSLCDDQ